MTNDEFFLVLPSNSSMRYFPDNATSCYTTHLSHEIRLHGQWTVGLTEILIPCTILHIQENEAKFIFSTGDYDPRKTPPADILDTQNPVYYDCTFPSGVYESIAEIAEAINQHEIAGKHVQLAPSKKKHGYYSIRRVCECTQAHYLHFNEKVRQIFGFEKLIYRTTDSISINPLRAKDLKGFIVKGDRPASLARAIPDQLYVYTDICVPYTVGDTQAALFRIVCHDSTKYKFGQTIVKQFSPANYIPLLTNSFQNIIIDIRDQHGKHVPFTFGTLTVVLHFKKSL